MPMPQMTDVLWDVMRADEMVSLQYPLDTGTIRFDTSLILYSQIAQQHNTTQQQFKKSLQFYKDRPDLMQMILGVVVDAVNEVLDIAAGHLEVRGFTAGSTALYSSSNRHKEQPRRNTP